MPHRLALLALIFLALPTFARASNPPAQRPFTYSLDTFAFANETVWNYVGGQVQKETPGAKKRQYTRHCFVVTRAAVQFWKFARFDPAAPRVSDDELALRIREVTGRSVWLPALPPEQRIVFPGYANLRQASAARPGLFQANIGLGWPIYFRAGNMAIVAPVPRSTEAHLNAEILRDLEHGQPTIVWLYNFPSLNINHVVVVYAGIVMGGAQRYTVYDPNYSNGPKHLQYDSTHGFTYQPTFYFKGGPVTARAVYRGVLQ